MTTAQTLTRRTWALAAGLSAVALVVGGLAGCAGLAGPQTITLSQAELTQILEKQFPLDRRMMEVLDVQITRPRLTLLPESNRLATELDVSASDRLFGRAMKGALALDYALRYDEVEHAIRLTQVHVNRFELTAVPENMRGVANRLGALLAEQLLADFPIYRIKPETLKAAGAMGVKPGAVTVTSRGVEVTLASAR
ncbi:MAG: hypothetical protein RJA98_316 [Pseudomonadota bacterium]|jgi:hypothetical protein